MIVDLNIVDTKTGYRQYISVCECVDPAFVKDNALKRFGLTMCDINVLSHTSDANLETIVGKVINTSKVVSMLIF